jgi:hypothetical protein
MPVLDLTSSSRAYSAAVIRKHCTSLQARAQVSSRIIDHQGARAHTYAACRSPQTAHNFFPARQKIVTKV